MFALSQGGSDYGGALDTDSGMLNTALGAAKGLLSMFKEYAKPETLEYLLTSVSNDLATQLEVVLQRSREYSELDDSQAAAFKDSFPSLIDLALRDVKAAVQQGVAAVLSAAGTDKLREAIDGLTIRERFNVNVRPSVLPETPMELFAFFEISGMRIAVRGSLHLLAQCSLTALLQGIGLDSPSLQISRR